MGVTVIALLASIAGSAALTLIFARGIDRVHGEDNLKDLLMAVLAIIGVVMIGLCLVIAGKRTLELEWLKWKVRVGGGAEDSPKGEGQ